MPVVVKDTGLDNDAVVAALYELVGKNFPIEVQVSNGFITYFKYETEWDEGDSTPILGEEITEPTRNQKVLRTVQNGEVKRRKVLRYEHTTTHKQLTPAEIDKIEKWVKGKTRP